MVSFLAYSSTLKREASYSSEASVDFEQTTSRYVQEDNAFIQEFLRLQQKVILMLNLQSK
jgi:hypothetical protein